MLLATTCSCISSGLKGPLILRSIAFKLSLYLQLNEIKENTRLLYDILFETKLYDQHGLQVLADFEKAFDTALKKFIFLV